MQVSNFIKSSSFSSFFLLVSDSLDPSDLVACRCLQEAWIVVPLNLMAFGMTDILMLNSQITLVVAGYG